MPNPRQDLAVDDSTLDPFCHPCIDLRDDRDRIVIIIFWSGDRKGRDRSGSNRRARTLHGDLEILGIVFCATDDEHILDAPGDEEMSAAQKAEIAGAKEWTLGSTCD